MNKLYVLLVGMMLMTACGGSKRVVKENQKQTPVDEVVTTLELDSLISAWTGELPDPEERETGQGRGVTFDVDTVSVEVYRAAAKRESDLLHTKLEVSFDWAKERVTGKATLTVRPYFRPMSTLTLDAKNFDIKAVVLEGANKILKYKYDGQQLVITLDKTYTNKEEYRLTIDYIAKPSEGLVGGSAAITQDKGLYFINPTGKEPNKPQQIWTQGETESNSRWFPTIDKPNERCTQEMYITVEDKFKTLSNGMLVSSTPNPDGTRTDYWRMNKPHAPYLFMLTVGEFAIVTEKWNTIDLQYYVEPAYEKDAKAIFPYTGDMLTFFSTKLGVPYPWQKYAQVVVRDYVSGAMENTTAVIFGDYMQAHTNELEGVQTNELVVAHEMFHHWFGDLVTCESWSNLTLNEGFANYSEYLWLENKYGKEEADQHRKEELDGYMESTKNGVHPLIYYQYADREAMFDAHSYNKGGLILHMLRNYVGDDAFYKALNLYLTRYAYTDVESHELRMAFEEVTGEDLNWFWNQWFYSEGHPELSVIQYYDAAEHKVRMTVTQTQTPSVKLPPVFMLPTYVDIHIGGTVRHEPITVTERSQNFSFEVAREPDMVLFDPGHVLLANVKTEKSEKMFAYQFTHAPSYFERLEAFDGVTSSNTEDALTIKNKALTDASLSIRTMALNAMEISEGDNQKRIQELATSDPNVNIRQMAVNMLAQIENKSSIATLSKIAATDKSPKVASDAFNALMLLDTKEAAKIAPKFENSSDPEIIPALSTLYGATDDTSHLQFFERNINNVKGYGQLPYLVSYGFLVARAEPAKRDATVQLFKMMLEDPKSPIEARTGSFAAIRAVVVVLSEKDAANPTSQKLTEYLQQAFGKETDEQAKSVFRQLLESNLKGE